MLPPEIVLDATLADKDPRISAAWLAYALTRFYWGTERFAREHPQAQGYKYTFAEEVHARESMLLIWKGERGGDLRDMYLDDLVNVHEAGFLNEYVWTFLWQPEWLPDPNLRVSEFDEWRQTNLPQHAAITLAWYTQSTL